MKTIVKIKYLDGFNIIELEDLLRELSERENRQWYYDEFTFKETGDNKGEITITYKDYSDSVEPLPSIILTEFKLIDYDFIEEILNVSN